MWLPGPPGPLRDEPSGLPAERAQQSIYVLSQCLATYFYELNDARARHARLSLSHRASFQRGSEVGNIMLRVGPTSIYLSIALHSSPAPPARAWRGTGFSAGRSNRSVVAGPAAAAGGAGIFGEIPGCYLACRFQISFCVHACPCREAHLLCAGRGCDQEEQMIGKPEFIHGKWKREGKKKRGRKEETKKKKKSQCVWPRPCFVWDVVRHETNRE